MSADDYAPTDADLAALWETVHYRKRMFGRSELPGSDVRFQDPDGILPFLRSVLAEAQVGSRGPDGWHGDVPEYVVDNTGDSS